MSFRDLQSQPLWAAAAYAIGAALVWGAGTRLAGYADQIATRTGIGSGTAGVVLLGLVTSLPEIATSVTASIAGSGEAQSGWVLAGKTAVVAIVILFSGVLLTLTAESLASGIGMDTGLAGLTLLSAATSLPELSSAVAAVRLGRSEMAIGDIIGGNMANTALIFVADIGYREGPVLNHVDRVATVAAMLGILLTCFFLVGMIERRDHTIFRMGDDSLAVVFTYVSGVGLLFWMSGG